MISTIILNWNRADLLRKTVESYLETIKGEFELFIVDNASTDASHDYLRELDSQGQATVLFLESNVGGDAFNRALPLTRGDLVHFSANDLVFLPGWSEHAVAAFETFSDLGQLSLFADVPTDDEAWEQKPADARLSKGKMLYEARGNVSASSVLRASWFRERGLRVGTLENRPWRFPADGKLSLDIKAEGFWCAWSERYYVRNVGHEVAEFDANPVYYQENYANKPWLGIEGWETRVALQKSQPKVDRKSIIFGDRMTSPQRGGSVATDKLARLWSSFDAMTPDVETIEFLHALTRLVKPRRVLETRTWLGLSACAIGRALILNGFGHLTTLEVNPEAHAIALKNIEQYRVQAVITPLLATNPDFPPDQAYEMVVFDLASTISLDDFKRIATSLADRAIVVLHANSEQADDAVKVVQSLADTIKIEGLKLSTPGGIFVGCVNRHPANERARELS